MREVSRATRPMRRRTSGRGFDPGLEVAERGAPVLHDRGLRQEADDRVAVAVGRTLQPGAAALGPQDERVGVVDLLATALLALADREREAARAVELHDLDLGRLRLAGEDLLGAVRRAQRRWSAGHRGHAELRLLVRPLRVVLDVREGVEQLLRRRVDV